MEIIEKKLGKIFRRAGNGTRRALKRGQRTTNKNSTSSSEEFFSPVVTKDFVSLSSGVGQTSLAPKPLSRFARKTKSKQFSYFHVLLAGSLCRLEKFIKNSLKNDMKAIMINENQLPAGPEHHESNQYELIQELSNEIDHLSRKITNEEASIDLSNNKAIKYHDIDASMDGSVSDSTGLESGYLSDLISRCNQSPYNSPALSPNEINFTYSYLLKPRYYDKYKKQSENSDHPSLLLYRDPISLISGEVEDDITIPDFETSITKIQAYVSQTEYITTVFEFCGGGINELINDLENELNLWFNEQFGSIGIACELQWSVPEIHRKRSAENRMKAALLSALRFNNLRVLNMKNDMGKQLPITFISAITEENCLKNIELNTFQGIYRRHYTALLPLQHSETGHWHRPYWSLNKKPNNGEPLKPDINQFLFGTHPSELHKDSLVALNLKITVQNVFAPDLSTSRLLRIRINDLNDNKPVFSNISKMPQVFEIGEDYESGWDQIGKLHATDNDLPPHNSVYYYLLPSCSNRDAQFEIDKFDGVISIRRNATLANDEYTLCALASEFDMDGDLVVAYDSKNASMLEFKVKFKVKEADRRELHSLEHLNNNTVIIFGDNDYLIPFHRKENISTKFRLSSVAFKPSESSFSSKDTDEITGLVAVDEASGDVKIDPMLAEANEGILTLQIAPYMDHLQAYSIDNNFILKQVHNVKRGSILKFIFNQEPNFLSLNIKDFEKSAICFHLVKDGVILGQKTILSILSEAVNVNSTLSRLYQTYKVANIEQCWPTSSNSIQKLLPISRAALIWSGLILLIILVVFSFCAYACFITRYKEYLDTKSISIHSHGYGSSSFKASPLQFAKMTSTD